MTAIDHAETCTTTGQLRPPRWTPWILAGIAAGPLFVAVIIIQAVSHSDFHLADHPLSLLALGGHGWIQTANFIGCGSAVVVATFLQRRSPDRLTRWTGRMLIAYGTAVIVAGVLQADPWHGYPVGADETITWHGTVHNIAAAAAGLALVVATIATARSARRNGRTTWATASLVIGVGYVGLSIIGSATGNFIVAFVAGVSIWCWASVALATTQINHSTHLRISGQAISNR